MLKCPVPWMKSKSLPRTQGQQVGNENSIINGEERVEPIDLVVTEQEGKQCSIQDFWSGGKLRGALALNGVGESGSILPWKILNFTLPEMQSSIIQW